MKYPERTKIVESFPYESRLGYIAFCVERCLNEARRHPAAAEQLQKLPLLTEGVQMLWDRAERGIQADPARITAIQKHLETYESPDPKQEAVVYNADITLVQAARTLAKGMGVLQDPEKSPRYVAGALEGPYQSISQVYADGVESGDREVEVTDDALKRLKKWGNKPFSRKVFEGIPEWKRGELAKKYAAGMVKGSAEDED